MNNSNSNNSQVRYIASVYLYNMLQDFRHLLIFDFRTNFHETHIRDAFHIHSGLKRQQILNVVDLAERKAFDKQQKYKNLQKVRRYFFINQYQIDPKFEGLTFLLNVLAQRKTKEDKFYSLNESFSVFEKKYPFMLLNQAKLEEAAKKTKQQYDKVLLYPYAKFPSEIIPDKLYVGTVYSSNSQKQLSDLGIVSLIDFIDYNQEQKMAEFKTSHKSFLQIPINHNVSVIIDFDYINKLIDEKVSNGKVLLYCKDGQSISPAFAISYLMYKAKLDVQMATLKVCQAISRVQLNKMVYTQLLVYKPKK